MKRMKQFCRLYVFVVGLVFALAATFAAGFFGAALLGYGFECLLHGSAIKGAALILFGVLLVAVVIIAYAIAFKNKD